MTAPQREEAAHVLVFCRLASCLITSLKLFVGRDASAWVHRAYRQPGSAPTTESVVCNHLWHLFLWEVEKRPLLRNPEGGVPNCDECGAIHD